MKNLSENFTLEELTNSIAAKNLGIDNTPPAIAIACLRSLAINVLQPARDFIEAPITVSSGYRSPQLNKVLGGAKKSQHITGEAADIVCFDNSLLFNFIRNQLEFDQLIWEFGTDEQPDWIHVSYSMSANRMEVLRAKKVGKKTVYNFI